MPEVVRNVFGRSLDRSYITLPALDSAALYLGGFAPLIAGSTAAPDGIEFGVPAFGDDLRIGGIIKNFHKKGSRVPIWEEDTVAGTITAETGELPLKYTFSSTNDESNTTSGDYEMVDIFPIVPGDILEVSLWGAGTTSVARGTTVAWGTTDSSANIGVGLAVDTTYHFALLESGADKDIENKDFMTIELDGEKPKNPNRVYVMCIRSAFGSVVAD